MARLYYNRRIDLEEGVHGTENYLDHPFIDVGPQGIVGDIDHDRDRGLQMNVELPHTEDLFVEESPLLVVVLDLFRDLLQGDMVPLLRETKNHIIHQRLL